MAAQLSKAITRKTNRLRRLVMEYNSNVPVSETVAWDDICSPSSEIWLRLQPLVPHPVPQSVRMAAIKVFVLKRWAGEELEVLKEEMKNTITFCERDIAALSSTISALEASEVVTAFDRGCFCSSELDSTRPRMTWFHVVPALSPTLTPRT